MADMIALGELLIDFFSTVSGVSVAESLLRPEDGSGGTDKCLKEMN